MPIGTSFDYLESGHPLHEFLDDYPTVNCEQAAAVLRHVWSRLLR